MTRLRHNVLVVLTAAALVAAAAVSVAFATISDDEICWDPDVESPVECDDDE